MMGNSMKLWMDKSWRSANVYVDFIAGKILIAVWNWRREIIRWNVHHGRLKRLSEDSTPLSGRSQVSSHFLAWENYKWSTTDRRDRDRGGKWRKNNNRDCGSRLTANWVNILLHGGEQHARRCSLLRAEEQNFESIAAVSFSFQSFSCEFFSFSCFLSCFFSHYTSRWRHSLAASPHTTRTTAVVGDENLQSRFFFINELVMMSKLLQSAYHCQSDFDECSIKYHLGSSWDLINFSSKACQSESKHWRQISSHRSDWRDMSTHHMFTVRRRARLVSRKYTNIITPIDDIESRNYLSRHFSGRR